MTRAKDRLASKWQDPDPELSVPQAALCQLQETDDSLSAMRVIADDEETSTVFWDEGILYCTGKHQIYSPAKIVQEAGVAAGSQYSHVWSPCKGKGHGRNFTGQLCFVMLMSLDYCKSCEVCQKTCLQKIRRSRTPIVHYLSYKQHCNGHCWSIAKESIGPPFCSDYATRYPEAIPMKSADAEHVAEELVKVFARVGIPREILSDQGSSFKSKLLQELYRLLRVEALRMSPYHPQTDGLVEHFNKTLEDMMLPRMVKTGTNSFQISCTHLVINSAETNVSTRLSQEKLQPFVNPHNAYLMHGEVRWSLFLRSYQFTVRYHHGN